MQTMEEKLQVVNENFKESLAKMAVPTQEMKNFDFSTLTENLLNNASKCF